jgi:hypothetical protein
VDTGPAQPLLSAFASLDRLSPLDRMIFLLRRVFSSDLFVSALFYPPVVLSIRWFLFAATSYPLAVVLFITIFLVRGDIKLFYVCSLVD